MSKNRLLVWLLCGFFLVAATYSFGAGFALYEGSARGNALGGLTGTADDASALFFNPAGITQLDGVQFMGGVTLIAPFGDFELTNTYDGVTGGAEYEDNVFTPPHLYYTRPLIDDKLWLGLAVYSRFGLGTEYDPNWAGRYSNVNTLIETVSFNPSLAYKVSDKASFAFGVTITRIEASFDQAIDATRFFAEPPNDPRTSEFDVRQKIEADNVGYGFNIAGFFTPNDQWSFGFHYYSEIEQEFDNGVAHFTKPAGLPATWFVDTDVTADPIDLPQMLMLGLGFKASDSLTVSGGVIWNGWSSIEELVFNYEQPFIVIPGLDLALNQATRELKWDDTFRYNIGFEHMINERFNFMWGVVFDESPVPDETVSFLLPSNDRLLLNFGFRYKMSKWTLDGSYTYLSMSDRTISNRQVSEGVLPAEVDGAGAHLLGFSLSRKF